MTQGNNAENTAPPLCILPTAVLFCRKALCIMRKKITFFPVLVLTLEAGVIILYLVG
jgi:hypothetical protein